MNQSQDTSKYQRKHLVIVIHKTLIKNQLELKIDERKQQQSLNHHRHYYDAKEYKCFTYLTMKRIVNISFVKGKEIQSEIFMIIFLIYILPSIVKIVLLSMLFQLKHFEICDNKIGINIPISSNILPLK